MSFFIEPAPQTPEEHRIVARSARTRANAERLADIKAAENARIDAYHRLSPAQRQLVDDLNQLLRLPSAAAS